MSQKTELLCLIRSLRQHGKNKKVRIEFYEYLKFKKFWSRKKKKKSHLFQLLKKNFFGDSEMVSKAAECVGQCCIRFLIIHVCHGNKVERKTRSAEAEWARYDSSLPNSSLCPIQMQCKCKMSVPRIKDTLCLSCGKRPPDCQCQQLEGFRAHAATSWWLCDIHTEDATEALWEATRLETGGDSASESVILHTTS